VRIRLTPRETSFYDLFAASANNLVTGSKLLLELLGADVAARSEIADRMRAAEHAGDEATHTIFHQLNSSFITPFDREDIYNLASSLDDIMDFMEEAVDLVVLYEIDTLPKGVEQQIEVLARAAELTASAMPNLRTMDNLTEYWIEVNRLENQADQIHRKLLAHLFGGQYEAIEVLKLKQVVDVLEEARRVRTCGEHGGDHRRQGVLNHTWTSSDWYWSLPSPSASPIPTASTTRPTRSRPRSPRVR
jgi:predicted phosphate transport protein (TIGR00153 family)